METCSNGHAEIVHDEFTCPLCEKQEEVWAKERMIEDLEAKNDRYIQTNAICTL